MLAEEKSTGLAKTERQKDMGRSAFAAYAVFAGLRCRVYLRVKIVNL
jgi:hypothetical protein